MKTVTTQKTARRYTRHKRIRARISGTATRPRLVVYKSNKRIYVQLVDDTRGETLASASSAGSKKKGQREQAKEVGATIAAAAKENKISSVVFDRGGFNYTGVIKELADTARSAGLTF